MRLIGLTGGIASGKSEAALRFAERGIPVLNADTIGHELIAPGGAAEAAVVSAFGDGILTDGAVDRAKLGALVFGNSEARETLNGIVHPGIRREVARRARDLAEAGHAAAILEAALLSEAGAPEPCLDGLIVVLCSRAVRVARLVRTRGLSREEAERRIDAQTPVEKKLALADWVIENETTLAALQRRVDEIIESIEEPRRGKR